MKKISAGLLKRQWNVQYKNLSNFLMSFGFVFFFRISSKCFLDVRQEFFSRFVKLHFVCLDEKFDKKTFLSHIFIFQFFGHLIKSLLNCWTNLFSAGVSNLHSACPEEQFDHFFSNKN